MSKHAWRCLFLALLVAGVAVAGEEIPNELFAERIEAMPELPVPLPQSVSASFDAAQSVDGNGSVRVDYASAEPRSMVLYEVPNPGVNDCAVWCEASLRGANLKNIAYLEMWCDFGDSQYFSRGLDQVIQGDTDWQKVRIPFFLEAGRVPERFLIGVRMEGPGTVWMDDLKLTWAPQAAAGAGSVRIDVPDLKVITAGFAGGLLGLFGALCGLWGALGGVLAPRGKARAFVLTTGWVLTAAGLVLLVAGVLLMGSNSPLGWPCLLAGFIVSVVMTPLNFVMRRAYQQAEMRRLAAQDL